MPVKGTVLIKSKTNPQNPNKTRLLKKNYAINLIYLTFIVRHLNPVFVLTVQSFLLDGPLNAQYTCRGLER